MIKLKTTQQWADKHGFTCNCEEVWPIHGARCPVGIYASAIRTAVNEALDIAAHEAQKIHDQWKSDDGPEAKLYEVDRIAGRLSALQVRDAILDIKEPTP